MANVENLRPNERGEHRGHRGRQAGVKNRVTRILKTAALNAAERSKHSDGSVEGYCLFLANEHPIVFAHLLAKLIPQQLKAEGSVHVDLEKIRLDMKMPLDQMVKNFEMRIKNPDYRPLPRYIEHDDAEASDD